MFPRHFLSVLVATALLAACSRGTACEELRKRIGYDPAVAGMTREEECEQGLEEYKQLEQQAEDFGLPLNFNNKPPVEDKSDTTTSAPFTQEEMYEGAGENLGDAIDEAQAWIEEMEKDRPTIYKLSPNPVYADQIATITGAQFNDRSFVQFGASDNNPKHTLVSSTKLTFRVPQDASGVIPVRVANQDHFSVTRRVSNTFELQVINE